MQIFDKNRPLLPRKSSEIANLTEIDESLWNVHKIIFESLFVLHSIFSLDERINLRMLPLSERFRRAEEDILRQIRAFCAYRIEYSDAGLKFRNNPQHND